MEREGGEKRHTQQRLPKSDPASWLLHLRRWVLQQPSRRVSRHAAATRPKAGRKGVLKARHRAKEEEEDDEGCMGKTPAVFELELAVGFLERI